MQATVIYAFKFFQNQYFKPLKDARTHLQLTPLIFKVIITVIKAIYNNGRIYEK